MSYLLYLIAKKLHKKLTACCKKENSKKESNNFHKYTRMILILLLICTCLNISYQSHFRGGSITAKPINFTSSQVTLELTLTLSWRLSMSAAYFCNDTTVANNDLTFLSTK
jgi:hypothetical protein